jgi:hypothetical protein
MRRQLVAAALLAPLAVPVSACMTRTPQQVAVVATPSALDSISARLVELELQSVSSGSAARTQTESASTLSSEIASLHVRLRTQPSGEALDSAAQARVRLALDARAATLGSLIQRARLVYTDEYPPVRQALDEKRLIAQRLAEISKR